MSQVTVFVPLYDGLYDPAYGPHVYQGHLTESEVEAQGRKLGSLDEPNSGYCQLAIEGNEEQGWYVSYSGEDDIEPQPSDVGGLTFHETEAEGKLAYQVEYRTLAAS